MFVNKTDMASDELLAVLSAASVVTTVAISAAKKTTKAKPVSVGEAVVFETW